MITVRTCIALKLTACLPLSFVKAINGASGDTLVMGGKLDIDDVDVDFARRRRSGSGGLCHCRFVSLEFAERQNFGSTSAKL